MIRSICPFFVLLRPHESWTAGRAVSFSPCVFRETVDVLVYSSSHTCLNKAEKSKPGGLDGWMDDEQQAAPMHACNSI